MEIKRNYYLNKLIEAKEDGLIKVVTGIRRCGKSYLLDPLFKTYLLNNGVKEDHIIKIELDNEDNEQLLDSKNLSQYIKSKMVDNDMYFVLLDEIQMVDGFEFVLNGLLYERNIDIYVTGSNSKFLSSDIITEFRGRGEEIKLYPLSFSEFLESYNGETLQAWEEYSTYGGLPIIRTTMDTPERKVSYLREQAQNVYLNDVIERNKINNESSILNTLLEIISSSIGSLINPKKISDSFKSTAKIDIAPTTIATYLKYLEEAFIIEKANRYDVKGRKYINTPVKYYFTDIGIRNSLINYRQYEETHIMENVIYLELRRRGYEVDVGSVEQRETLKGKKEYKQLEIDFIANKGNEKCYIQSAYQVAESEKREQELRPLLSINDSFKKFIITMDYVSPWRDDNGIITMNLFDFLKDIKSLDF